MNLVRTSLLSGISVLIRTGTGLLLNKILALYVGPAGYVAIGHFQSLVTMLTTLATGGISTGVVKLTAEHANNNPKILTIWRTAAFITTAGSLLFGLTILMLRDWLSEALLDDSGFRSVFVWLSISIVFLGFNGLLLAVLNGIKDIRGYVKVNIAGALTGLVVTAVAVRIWGLTGALVALCANQAVMLVAAIVICRNATWLRLSNFVGKVDSKIAKNLGGFALMAVTSAVIAPLIQIGVRSYANHQFGAAYAGYWEAMQRISSTYLGLVTTTLAVYYLPRIAELADGKAIREEISATGRIVLPVVATMALTIFFARDSIISILFTRDFEDMRILFPWQLLGDVLKIASWLYAYVLVGRAMSLPYILAELWFGLQAYLLAHLFGNLFGFEGLALAHATNYLIYLCIMFATFKFEFRADIRRIN